MKKALKIVTLLMLVILVVTAFAMPADAKQVFTDLSPEHWCYSKIMDFEKKGYVCGYSDDTFRADRTITRAEYVKIVNNFFGYKPSEKTTSAFKDVNSGDWFMPYVNAAVDIGYIEGFEDGTFRPQDPIRRQEATVILARILKIDEEVYPADHKDGLAQYSDSDEVQEWARVAIHSYSVYNFINGYEDGTLRILRNVTRAETVELLNTLEQKVVIDRKGSGGTKTKTSTLKPDIDVLVRELIEVPIEDEIVVEEEYIPAIYTKSNWINKKNSTFEKETAKNGAFVNITSQTTGAKIHDTVDLIERKAEYTTTKRDEYDNIFFLTDGVYTVTAQATKTGKKDSAIENKVIKIDTVAPIVNLVATSSASGEIAHEQSITIAVKDINLYNTNEISGLDKVAYAWFNADTDERVTVWSAFELTNGQAQINAPLTYGKYKLGIAAIDVAENTFGTQTEYAVKSGDISGDVPTTPSGDVDYDFVKETESGDENPSGEEIIVIVGNNNPTIEDLTMYTTVNKSVSGELKGKDIDSGDILSYELLENATSGEATVNDNITTFVSNEAGTYEYTIKVRDNHSGEAIGNVTVYVFDAKVKIPESPSGDEIKDPVDPTKPVNPDLSGEKLVLFVDEEKEMTASVTPSGSPVKDVKYAWSFGANEEKAEISSEANESKVTIKGLKPGETKITVKVDVEVEIPSGDTKTVEIEKQITVIVLSRITIKISDDTRAYDGIALKAEDFEVRSGDEALKTGVMADGDVAKVRVSGERLYVGSSDATLVNYDIVDSNNNSVRKYYVPTFEKGTLTVTANKKEIIITANSANKEYDGTTLKDSGYTYTSGVLVSGDVLEAVVSGEQLNAGLGDNKVISYKVTRNGQDVTENYTFGESKNGVLKVTKRTITLTSASAIKVYDGNPLTSGDVTVAGNGFVTGEGASYDVTGTITNVGKVDNEFTYTLNDGTLAGNYEITTIEGTLEVTPITDEVIVKVKGNRASGEKYDGIAKSVEGYEVVEITNSLYNSGDVSYSGDAIAKGINAGTYLMNLNKDNFKNNSKNFTNVKFELVEDGELIVAKRVVELISASDEKEYDGKPLTNNKIIVSGDRFAKNEEATYKVTGTQTDIGSSKNKFEYELKDGTLKDNYAITQTLGILTVTPLRKALNATITCDYPKNGKKAEPTDMVNYKIKLEENSGEGVINYPKTIVIKVSNATEETEVTNLPSNATYDSTTNEIKWILNDADTSKELNYSIKVNKNEPAGSEIITSVESGATCEKNHTLNIEETVYISSETDKNIILVLDRSRSMWNNYETRMKPMQEAANDFINTVVAQKGKTNLTITLITFWNDSQIDGRYDSRKNTDASELKSILNNLKNDSKKYQGTNAGSAIKLALDTFSGDTMIKNGKNIMIFLTDGASTEEGKLNYESNLSTKTRFLNSDITAFAIGVVTESDDLKIVAQKGGFYKVDDSQGLMDAFSEIAYAVDSIQSDEGVIEIEAENEDSIYPIHISHDDMDVIVVDSLKLEENNLEVNGTTVVWNISEYPGHKKFNIALCKNDEVNSVSIDDLNSIITNENEVKNIGDEQLNQLENLSGENLSQGRNMNEATTISGEDSGDPKKIEMENVDVKNENQEVDNENQVNETKDEQNQEENQEGLKFEENNNEEMIFEEKNEPVVVEEKQDDDNNQTSNNDEDEQNDSNEEKDENKQSDTSEEDKEAE